MISFAFSLSKGTDEPKFKNVSGEQVNASKAEKYNILLQRSKKTAAFFEMKSSSVKALKFIYYVNFLAVFAMLIAASRKD